MFHRFVSRCARNGIAVLLGVILPAGFSVAAYPPPPLPSPTNNSPTNQIRFSTPAGADAKRQQLIHYIWPGGLPTNVPATVTTNVAFADGLKSYVSRVDMLDAKVMGMDNVAYLVTPKVINANTDRLVISHGGHNPPEPPLGSRPYDIADSPRDPVPSLLRAGYSVLRIQMPFCSWNGNYTTLTPPGMGTVTITTKGSSGHNELFQKVAPTLGGRTFQFFLEPIVEGINYFKSVRPHLKDVSMFGLSGGGWATSMAAAIDTRIKQSAAGSGSWPLYIRNAGFGRGDAEQVYAPLYREDIAPDGSGGGVATWSEIYALGGYGNGRSQVMWSNQGEPDSLFGGTHADRFKGIVSDKVMSLGAGKWAYVYDTTGGAGASAHTITPWAVNHIILPLFCRQY